MIRALFIASCCYALACGVDDPCAEAESTDMRLPAFIFTTTISVLSACGGDDAQTSSSTSALTTGADLLELGQPCIVPPPGSDEPCADGLMCAGANDCDQGYCMKLCDPRISTECEAVDGVVSTCGPYFSGDERNVCRFACGGIGGTACPVSFEQELVCGVPGPLHCIPPQSGCDE